MRRYARSLTVIAVLIALSVLALSFQTIKIGGFKRGGETPLGLNLGLDLQGGSHLVYQAIDRDTGEPIAPPAEQMSALKRSIEGRVNAAGLGQPIIQILGDDRLLIQLPGIRDTERAKLLIGETAQLVYKHTRLNVSRDIPGVSSDDIVSIKVIDAQEPGATSTDPALEAAISATTSVAGVAAGTQATTTEAAAGRAASAPPIPALLIEFNEEAAGQFADAVERLRVSLDPIPNTERIVDGEPVPGTGDVYANFVTISAEGDTDPALRVPYSPLIEGPFGRTIPLPGDPLIERVDGGGSFMVQLTGTDMATAQARFEVEPGRIRLGETLGRVDDDIPGGLTGEDMARAYAGQHQSTGLPIINIEFNAEGARKFGEITTQIAGTPDLLTVFLDNRQEIRPTSVDVPILSGAAFIESRAFTFERVRDLALLLESGRLPVPIELIQERSIDAILGADSLARSTRAGLVGLVLVLLFMVLYYRAPGVIAAGSLLIYGALLLATFKMLPVTLTLSGVAAVILSIGMAVDANILIFERMKEELRAGRTVLSAVNIGFNRAWTAIRDSNASTLITCAILFWFADTLGASIVQGFAITLAIGVGISMFSAITVSRTFLRLTAATPLGKRLELFVPAGGEDLPQRRAQGDKT